MHQALLLSRSIKQLGNDLLIIDARKGPTVPLLAEFNRFTISLDILDTVRQPQGVNVSSKMRQAFLASEKISTQQRLRLQSG